jgi:hypothetical protein
VITGFATSIASRRSACKIFHTHYIAAPAAFVGKKPIINNMKNIVIDAEAAQNLYKCLRHQAARCLVKSRKGDVLQDINLKWYRKYKDEAEGIASLLFVATLEFPSGEAAIKFLRNK